MGGQPSDRLPIIPDFMLVDSKFIYGRVRPEEIHEDPLQRRGVVLRFNSVPEVVQAYEAVFRRLWEESFDPRELGAILLQNSYEGTRESISQRTAATIKRFEQAAAGLDEQVKGSFRRVLQILVEDVVHACNFKEREARYRDLPPKAGGAQIVRYFADNCITPSQGAILAIDQADVKTKVIRFWKKWAQDETYRAFDVATKSSLASDKRRIFVVSQWQGVDSIEAYEFFKGQIRDGVIIGLIHSEDLRIVAQAAIDDGADQRPSSLANLDSDFILTGLHQEGGQWSIDLDARGFEVGYSEFALDEIEYKNTLCRDRMEKLAGWFSIIWDSPSCHKFTTISPGLSYLRDLVTDLAKSEDGNAPDAAAVQA